MKAQELTTSAECWLERGSRERARDLFAQAAQVGRGTAAGETALVEVGRLAALLEDSRVALAASDEYLRDYPNGRLREVAAFRRCEMLVALGHGTESASCLATYRAAYPRGLRRAQATLWLARLRQGTGSYVEAAELLAEFLRHAPRAKERADAWYELILCRERAGSAGSREALDSALKEFPEDPRLADLRRRMRP